MISSDPESTNDIVDTIMSDIAPYDSLVEKVFRRQSIDENIPITELVFEGKYRQKYSK